MHRLREYTSQLETGWSQVTKELLKNFSFQQQIIDSSINLIFNAIDAIPNGGATDLSAQYDAEKNKAIIVVKDTGTGIDSKDLPHIFEPFFTTKGAGKGTGLGLSISYGIIHDYGGSITVTAGRMIGALFVITFPFTAR